MTVCNNFYEDAYQPNLLHLTIDDTRVGDLTADNIGHNISLHQACEEGRLCTVQFILTQRPADINTRDKLGRTPVMAAVMSHQVNVFDFLTNKGCDLMAVDKNNDTVLHVACSFGEVDIVRNLVNHKCDIESRGDRGRTPVVKSALYGHRDIFDLLFSIGCNVTILNDNMNNILHMACSCGHVDMVKYVLTKLHSDIESKGEKGRTPVMIAAHSGHTEVFDFLASNGSNLFAVDHNRDNIIHAACIGGHVDMVQHILNKTSIDIESKAKHGWTPVMKAAQYGRISVVDLLCSKYCNLKAVDDNMNTLLHVACIEGRLAMVRHICSKLNFLTDGRGHDGQTPVMIAAIQGHTDVVKYLVSEGCNLELLDKYGNNVLHTACRGGRVDMVKHILSQTNVSIDSRGTYGRTPVMFAAYCGHMPIFMFLLNLKLEMLDANRNNILHVSCMGGHVNIVKHIVLKGNIGIDSRGQYGRTPVMCAAYFGHKSVFTFLVKQGCNQMILDENKNNMLNVACVGGHVNIVKHIVGKGKYEIESRGQLGRTPVMHAALCGHADVVRYLVGKECKLSVVDVTGNNILHMACLSSSVDMVKFIISQTNTGIDSRGQYGCTPVMIAAGLGQMDIVRYLVRKRCKLSVVDSYKNTLLHAACRSGIVDMVKYILSHMKTGMERRGQFGQTPVMVATRLGHINVVRYLVGKGCKLSVVDAFGDTMLQMACMSSSVDMVKYILTQTNIGIDSLGQFGRPPVMLAAARGRVDVVRYLVRKGCKLSLLDSHHNNLLHAACYSGIVDMVKYIHSQMKTGIDSKGRYGWTPVMTAAARGHIDIVKYLVSEGCKLLMVASNRDNILHVVCSSKNVNMVKYILSQTQIGIESRGNFGRTPVMHAAALGNMKVVKYLVGRRCKLGSVDERGMNALEMACVGRHGDVIKYLISIKQWPKKC